MAKSGHKKKWKSIIVLMTSVLILAACAGDDDDGSGGDGDLPVIKMHGLEGATSSGVLRIIENEGFDEDHGFQLEMFEVAGDASVQFLLQGNSDVSFDGDPMTAALLREQGEDISTFYPLLAQEATLLTRGDAPYDDPQDLIGEKVGHDGLESGTMTAALIMFDQFEDIQLQEDYDLQLTSEAALIRLVDRGELEAAFAGQPGILQAEIEFGLKAIWGPGAEVWKEERGGGAWLASIMARESWLKENPDLAEAVTAAWDDAYEWIQEDPTRLTGDPEMSHFLGTDNPEVLDAFAQYLEETEYFTNRWTDEDVQAARDFNEFAAENDIVIKEADPDAVLSLDDLDEL